MNNLQRYKFFSILERSNPNPTTELNYSSPFELLIAVILSAQSTDVSVNKVTNRLYAIANTPETILALGEDSFKDYIKNIGLFNSKASYVIKTCYQLIELHNSKVPDNRSALEALPGVGRKTANVILNTVFNYPVIAVDTHLFRLANLTGLAKGTTVRAVEDALVKVVPRKFMIRAHHWLILHGRYICKAKRPLCDQCIVSHLCDEFLRQQRRMS